MKIKLCFCLMACLFADRGNQLRADEAMWKAGVAKVVVTPETSMWMAGYASRNKPSEGKVHDLHVKALALEDQDEHRMVIVTADLISIPRDLRNWLQDECPIPTAARNSVPAKFPFTAPQLNRFHIQRITTTTSSNKSWSWWAPHCRTFSQLKSATPTAEQDSP